MRRLHPGKVSNGAKCLLLLLLSALLLACETVGYYSQAVRGQIAILASREDIAQLLASDSLDLQLRHKLQLVLDAREFAVEKLALPAGDNYRSYVNLGREHAVWNVFAAPEFSTEPLSWCFPVAGCVAYRGYFSEEAARNYAGSLSARGYDVYLGGVDAYSTLGWFDDPLFSTVINRPDAQLAGLIFHELAHQLLYLPGDTTFNESFASVVEQEGTRRWLEARGETKTGSENILRTQYQYQFTTLVLDFRDRFAQLYHQAIPDQAKREGKLRLQEQLRERYRQLQAQWSGYDGYDNWFAGPLNNAQLSTVAAYNDLVTPMQAILREADGDLLAFYQRMQGLAKLDQAQRDLELGVSDRGGGE